MTLLPSMAKVPSGMLLIYNKEVNNFSIKINSVCSINTREIAGHSLIIYADFA
jgi:hypothetical protein